LKFAADDESCDTQETAKSQGQGPQQQQQQLVQMQQKYGGIHAQSLAVLFPSCLCSAVVDIIGLLDDAAVSADGNSVYEVAYQVRLSEFSKKFSLCITQNGLI